MQKILIFSFFLSSVLFFSSCSSSRPEGKTEAEILYKEAQQLVTDKRYQVAIEKLNTLRSQYSYSFYATQAELLQADIYFKQENYIEAASAYILFRDFHPKHERLPYVMNQIGDSFFSQLPSTIDRDLTSAHEAIRYYNELLHSYPDSEYVSKAQKNIQTCQKMIEDREKYIADFYFKTKVYPSAIFRYQGIISSFETPELLDHSMERIVQAEKNLKNYLECIKYADEYMPKFSSPKLRKDVENLKEECVNKAK